jgi:hypothetical protein
MLVGFVVTMVRDELRSIRVLASCGDDPLKRFVTQNRNRSNYEIILSLKSGGQMSFS